MSGSIVEPLTVAADEWSVSAAAIDAWRQKKQPNWGRKNRIRRREPTWGDPNVLAEILPLLAPNNHPHLAAAVSLAYPRARALQLIRNAAAHNHSESVSELLGIRSSYVAFEITHPTQALYWLDGPSRDFLATRSLAELSSVAALAVH